MDTETLYIGHDNTINLLFKASSAAYSMTSVVNITATFGALKISGSSSATSGALTWSGSGWSTGEVRLTLQSLSASSIPNTGVYNVPFIVYDAGHTSGIVWDYVPIRIKADPEGS